MELLVNEIQGRFPERFEPKTCWHELQKCKLQSIIGPNLLLSQHVKPSKDTINFAHISCKDYLLIA